jgi:hypothetical protein
MKDEAGRRGPTTGSARFRTLLGFDPVGATMRLRSINRPGRCYPVIQAGIQP